MVADNHGFLCELTTTGVPQTQLTPATSDCILILEKGYMWEVEPVLRGYGGLVETQLGCQHQRPGSDSTPN